MNRYVSSFIISAVIYLAVIIGLIYVATIDDYCYAKVETQNVKKVNFSIITPPKCPKPIPTPKPKPKKKKKPKPKPKPKPEPKPIPEPEPTPEPEPEPIIEEEIVEEIQEPIEEITEEVEEEIIESDEIITEAQSEVSQEMLAAKQDLFIANLIERINSNKSYPNMARRRCIEGIVDVKFKILSDGSVKDIEIVSGKKVFKKSVVQAITRSFPMSVESSLFGFPKEFKIKISYVLK